MTISTGDCPVWCNREHSEPGDAMPVQGGYFHDSSRDIVDAVIDAEAWSVGVSMYVTVAGVVEAPTVELQGRGRLAPSEARQLADVLYVAADIARCSA